MKAASVLATLGGGTGQPFARPRLVTFARRVDVSYELAADRLTQRWALDAVDGTLVLGRSRLVEAQRGRGGDGRRLEVRLGRGPLRSATTMELEVVRWSMSFGTALDMHPTGPVRPSEAYFREGNAVLDRLTDVVMGVPRPWPVRRSAAPVTLVIPPTRRY